MTEYALLKLKVTVKVNVLLWKTFFVYYACDLRPPFCCDVYTDIKGSVSTFSG